MAVSTETVFVRLRRAFELNAKPVVSICNAMIDPEKIDPEAPREQMLADLNRLSEILSAYPEEQTDELQAEGLTPTDYRDAAGRLVPATYVFDGKHVDKITFMRNGAPHDVNIEGAGIPAKIGFMPNGDIRLTQSSKQGVTYSLRPDSPLHALLRSGKFSMPVDGEPDSIGVIEGAQDPDVLEIA